MNYMIDRLSAYIDALRSKKVDGKLFADLEEQQAYFRRKCMDEIPLGLLNWSEVTRQAGMSRARWQDITRGKVNATADDFAAIRDVLKSHLS